MKIFSPEHVDIANWIRAQISDGVDRLVLRQRVRDIDQHVREWALQPSTDPDALAEEIRVKASDEGRQFRGPIQYGVFSYRGIGSTAYYDRHFFRVEGMANGGEALISETEFSDGRGLVSQMMRHTEASAKIALGQTLEIVEHYKSILRARDVRIAALEAKYEEVMELQERLLSSQHERKLEEIKAKSADRGRAFIRDKLDLLTPVLMSKMLSGGKPAGEGSVLGEELLRQFLKSLRPEQVAALTNGLNPEQVVTLSEILERYSDRETEMKAAAAAKAAAANDTAVPDAEITDASVDDEKKDTTPPEASESQRKEQK
jgi:hypothetical protein